MKVYLQPVIMRGIPFFILLLVILFSSCRKDPFFDPQSFELSFSSDTVYFDTVFTARGSATYSFKVYNNSRSPVTLSNISLGKGTSSSFILNVDGTAGMSVPNVEIAGRDSLYIFAQVSIDPLNANSPLVVTDSVVFEVFGKRQHVQLVAWGQDAHYFRPEFDTPGLPPYSIIAQTNQNITWPNDKPYVIYGYAVIDSAAILNIDPGVRIHFHKNSGLWVYKAGTIKVNGTKDLPVTFQGDRLEPEYREEPGQWDRILVNDGSMDNEFNYAIIKNGFIGIQAEVLPPTAYLSSLKINNTIIKNMSSAGIFTRFYDKITGYNDLIYNCGQYALAVTLGGTYDFTHLTIGNYWNAGSRKTPSVYINNFNEVQSLPLDFTLSNSIIYGDQENEFIADVKNNPSYKLRNCLVKSTLPFTDAAHFEQILVNSDPEFENRQELNYTLKSTSPAIDKGNITYTGTLMFDLDNKTRVVNGIPDLGAFERQ